MTSTLTFHTALLTSFTCVDHRHRWIFWGAWTGNFDIPSGGLSHWGPIAVALALFNGAPDLARLEQPRLVALLVCEVKHVRECLSDISREVYFILSSPISCAVSAQVSACILCSFSLSLPPSPLLPPPYCFNHLAAEGNGVPSPSDDHRGLNSSSCLYFENVVVMVSPKNFKALNFLSWRCDLATFLFEMIKIRFT